MKDGTEYVTGGNDGASVTGRKKDARANTAIRFPPELHEDLRKASLALGLPINFLVNYAVRDFLDHMIDPTEFTLTRRRARGD